MQVFLLSIGKVAKYLGVCSKTLRRWDKNGSVTSDFRTKGNHRRYDKTKIYTIARRQIEKPKMPTGAIYGRVSSSRQKKSGDLNRQLKTLKKYSQYKGYFLYKSYSDVGSGLNDKRKGLLKLLKDSF